MKWEEEKSSRVWDAMKEATFFIVFVVVENGGCGDDELIKGEGFKAEYTLRHQVSPLGSVYIQGFRVKEGLSCVFSRATWRGKVRTLALP